MRKSTSTCTIQLLAALFFLSLLVLAGKCSGNLQKQISENRLRQSKEAYALWVKVTGNPKNLGLDEWETLRWEARKSRGAWGERDSWARDALEVRKGDD